MSDSQAFASYSFESLLNNCVFAHDFHNVKNSPLCHSASRVVSLLSPNLSLQFASLPTSWPTGSGPHNFVPESPPPPLHPYDLSVPYLDVLYFSAV